jgi:glutamate racemase
MDVVVLACTHFPLVEQELSNAAPRPLQFVDGKEGIARRTAFLTRGVAWPDVAPEGIAVFTRWTAESEYYRAGLAEFGLTRLIALEKHQGIC